MVGMVVLSPRGTTSDVVVMASYLSGGLLAPRLNQFTLSSCGAILVGETAYDLHRTWCAILGLNQ